MTVRERLTKMENTVRNFKIVVTGPGFVEGGFGHLPKSSDTHERIANLNRSIDKFTLRGSGVDVSGSFNGGYVISIPTNAPH